MKVVNPNDQNKEQGTKMLDLSTGKIVDTFSCKLDSSGRKYTAIGKTEADARSEVMARCRDGTLISSCDAKKVSCTKN